MANRRRVTAHRDLRRALRPPQARCTHLLQQRRKGGRGDRTAPAAVVVADDEDGLRLWQPIGAPLVLYRDGAGRSLKDAPIDELTGASLVHTRF